MTNPVEGQLAPYSQEAEEAVLGGLLVDGAQISGINSMLMPEDFYLVRHSYIFEAMIAIYRRGDPVDIVTLTDQLRADNHLSDIGGQGYLLMLVNNTPTSIHAPIYAKMVARTAARRRGLHAADELKALFMDEQLSLETIETEVFKRLAAAEFGRSERKLITLSDALIDYETSIEATEHMPSGRLTGVPTGFEFIDQKTEGFQLGDLIFLGARPSMGKTALLMSLVLMIAKKLRDGLLDHLAGKWIYVWTGEMRTRRLMQRIISAEAKINSITQRRGLREGGMNSADIRRFYETVGKLSGLQVVFDDTIGITPRQMHTHINEGVRYWGQPLFLAGDYLGLMRAEDQRVNKEQQVSSISRSLKHMALEFNAPFMMLAQLNRDLEKRENKRPQMSDLRDSGAIEQDGDIVSFLYRDVVYNKATPFPDQSEWIWAKNRDGEIGTYFLRYDRAHTLFTAPPPPVDLSLITSQLPLGQQPAGSGARAAGSIK